MNDISLKFGGLVDFITSDELTMESAVALETDFFFKWLKQATFDAITTKVDINSYQNS